MINLKDLPCYKGASAKHQKRVRDDMTFETDKVLPDYRVDIEGYIAYIGETKALSTVTSLLPSINVLISFLGTLSVKKMNLLLYGEQLRKEYKQYLLAKGYPLVRTRKRKERDPPEQIITSEYVAVFNGFWIWLTEKYDTRNEIEKDVWDVRKIEVIVKQNEISKRYRLDFRKIPKTFRNEVKSAIQLQLSIKAMQTLKGEIRSATRFFTFVAKCHSEIVDSKEIDRTIYEDYLIWLKVDSSCSNDVIKRDLSDLHLLFSFIAQLYNKDNLIELSHSRDGVHTKTQVPKTYSRTELERFHAVIDGEAKQLVRCLYIHELLGLRISDTLQLKKDCISADGSYIDVVQAKTHRPYKKQISIKVKALLERAIAYTDALGCESDLIFVRDNGEPYTYATISYHMQRLITAHNLTLDNGEPFRFLSHQFRRTLGTELTESGFSDRYIAAELGHSNTRSVSHYRRVRNAEMKKQTEQVRQYFSTLYKGD